MSHHHERIICPNCGFHTSENFCARCGQETHLHNETFWGLIVHFLGHYFHYDSKFWQSIKALWFSPGKLTLAFWNKQRMRYLPPVSFYIFISFVFFFTYSRIPEKRDMAVVTRSGNVDSVVSAKQADLPDFGNITIHADKNKGPQTHMEQAMTTFEKRVEADPKKFNEELMHTVPKIFFFMIPVMGFVLLLLFYRRQELTYVSHIITALHYHTFWFSLMFFEILYTFDKGATTVTTTALLIAAFYFVAMLRNVYGISWGRSIAYSFIVALSYVLFLIISLIFMVLAVGGVL